MKLSQSFNFPVYAPLWRSFQEHQPPFHFIPSFNRLRKIKKNKSKMQSAAIPISPSISPPFNKPRLISNLLRISPPSSRRLTSAAVNSHSSSLNLSSSSPSSRTDGLFSLPSLKFSRTKSRYDFVVRATSVPESSDAGEGQKVKNDFAVKATSVPESSDADEGLKSKHDFPVQATSVPESVDAGEGQKPKHDVAVKAMAVPESADGGEVQKSSSLFKTLELGLYFGLWYLFNIYFNIYNKQVLKVYNFPVTVTLSQFAVGSVFVGIMWLFNLYRPRVSAAQLAAILPLAVVHTLGNLFTNMSLGKVAVSFTHTIKAMEPFFSVLLSVVFLGEKPTQWVVLALLPIVGGVALASVTEASFNWAGFWSAMASNVTNQSRNVLSKKVMVNKEESLDNITLFSLITVMSFVLLAPATIFMEGVKFTPAYLEAAGLNVQQVYTRSLLAALCFHAYQQVSYMILQRVSPVTHSVGNCVKRVVVITSSVIFFKTPVSPINALGTGIALAGVFLYSRVKSIKPKPKAA